MKRRFLFILLFCIFSYSLKAQSGNYNYVKTVAPNFATTSTAGLSAPNSMISYQYFDDLGRPWQTVLVGRNPSSLDLVTYQEYDSVGRNSITWLPVCAASGNNGNPLSLNTVQSRSRSLSNYNDSKAYTKLVYETSPLERVLEQYGPGQAWHDNGKSIKAERLSNTLDGELACKWYRTTDTRSNVEVSIHAGNVCYPAGELYVTRATDEDGKGVTLEFKDKQNRLILTRQKNGEAYHDTYYVYDSYGNLRAVLPPLASDALAAAGTWTLATDGSDVLSRYAYLYNYDTYNRCVRKKLPGSGWTRYEYDYADRLIAVQDAEQASHSPALCTFYLYDDDNRPVVQGVCEFTGSLTVIGSSTMFVTLKRSSDGSIIANGLGKSGYNCGMSIYSPVVHTVNYYDDYGFRSLTGFNNSNFPAASHPGNGMLTGTVTTLLDGSEKKLYTVYYYDAKGRLEKTVSSNHLGGYDTTTTVYTFTGNPKTVTHVHTATGKSTQTEVYTYTYDHADRLTTVTHKLNNGTTVTLASNTYDNLGRLQSKLLHGNAANKQTYAYNVRNWLTGISGSKFTQNLYYNTGNGTARYNGNISSMTWKAGTESTVRGYKFTYDGLDRVLNATYGETANINTNIDRFSENVTGYDKNGNIKTLQRYGQTGTSTYGLIDNLTLTLNGNQLNRVDDAVSASAYNNGFEFKDGVKQANEYAYDKKGNLTKDLNKNITDIQYNFLNLPNKVTFVDGSTITYTYAADGTKLKVVHKIGDTTTTTDYCGDVIYENGAQKLLLTEEGYVTLSDSKYHYYLKDHLGNNRVVINQNGAVEETNHYYPFGGVFASSSSVQPYKYNGKEYDNKKGLNLYDYEARHYDASLGRFMMVDPLSEKYYEVGAYVYCGDNPVRHIDPTGMFYTGFTMDEKGYLKKVNNEGGNEYDVIYNQLKYSDKTSKDYDTSGNKTGIKISKGIVNEMAGDSRNMSTIVQRGPIVDNEGYKIGEYANHAYEVQSDKESLALMNFLDKNVGVEWGNTLMKDGQGNTLNLLMTSHNESTIKMGSYQIGKYVRRGFHVIRADHIHPTPGANVSSDGDKGSAKGVLHHSPKAIFRILNQGKYYPYTSEK